MPNVSFRKPSRSLLVHAHESSTNFASASAKSKPNEVRNLDDHKNKYRESGLGQLYTELFVNMHTTRKNSDKPRQRCPNENTTVDFDLLTANRHLRLRGGGAKVYKFETRFEGDLDGFLHHHEVRIILTRIFVIKSLDITGNSVSQSKKNR